MVKIPVYLGQPHECSYLPEMVAHSQFIDPGFPMNVAIYSELLARGFRRSGDLVYRPECQNCSACIPVRLELDQFCPNRSQRRTIKRNEDLQVVVKPPLFEQVHYDLYLRYLQARHAEGTMSCSGPDEYMHFLASRWADTVFVEFSRQQELIAVAVVDRLVDGWSSVYTFYAPELSERSLGVFAVLWQAAAAKSQGKRWLYLGFWIERCRKMAYKSQYRPLQALIGDQWLSYEKGEMISG